VTLRLRPGLPSLRRPRFVREFRRSLAEVAARGDFRVVHFSLQANHAHFLVEADDRGALGRGMKAVGSRLARAVNRIFTRTGPVLFERYHLHLLPTPRAVRNALAYVLRNGRKHAAQRGIAVRWRVDPASSAPWFAGWRGAPPPAPSGVSSPRSWLLRVGWRRHGPLDP
jgi:REP element-mobilizing transposase RayT